MRTKLIALLLLLLWSFFPVAAGEKGMAGMNHAMPTADKNWNEHKDATFLSGMIAHHEGAIAMTEPVLRTTQDPKVLKWAEDIVASQQSEIDEMRRLLDEIGMQDDEAAAVMRDEMHAMMTHKLSDDPDVNFVLLMIPHHAGAIDMSLPVLTATDNPRIRQLAEKIILAQTREIAEFRQWLDDKGKV